MPQKLTVRDYQFYLIRTVDGEYEFKGTRGVIARKTHEEYAEMQNLVSDEQKEWIIELFGIANVQNIHTGEFILVYQIFEDLQKENLPVPRQATLIQHLLEENRQLKIAVKQLKKLLEDNNILIITPEDK